MKKRVVLIDLADWHEHILDKQEDLLELQSLVKTYGGAVIVKIIQHRLRPDKSTYIGKGKAEELVYIVKKEKIDAVIINSVVNHVQLFNLTQMLWRSNPNILVWDRVDLILEIFQKHARTSDAKLQIDIARMEHMGPRIYGLGGSYFSRLGGGTGTRGKGQTNIELMKRHWKRMIHKKKEELKIVERQREDQILRRKKLDVKTVSIVGYTNAGKTSLFNILTGKTNIAKDAPFVTLDSTVGRLKGKNNSIIISDTIGFIKKLPTSLIQAFKTTLMECQYADLILHVIDISDKHIVENSETVDSILRELKVKAPVWRVYNKIDLLDKKTGGNHDTFYISCKGDLDGIDKLKESILSFMDKKS